MKTALVIVPDMILNGLHGSNVRTEGRWDLSAAEYLGKAGYLVDLISPWLGDIEEVFKDPDNPNIRFLRGNYIEYFQKTNRKYDLCFFHAPIYYDDPKLWERLKPYIRQAIFGDFWYQNINPNNKRPPKGVVRANPYREYFYEDTNFRIFQLPSYTIDSYKSSAFDKKTLVWTPRKGFTNDRSDARVAVNHYHLRAVLEAAKRGYKVIMLCAGSDINLNHPGAPPVRDDIASRIRDTLKELRSIPSVEFYDYLPQHEFDQHIMRASIGIIADGQGDSLRRMIPNGIVPLAWDGFSVGYFSKESLAQLSGRSNLGYEQVTQEMINTRLFKLLEDEEYFNTELNCLKEGCSLMTTTQVIDKIHSIVSQIEGEIE